jgi:hypothetical protein
MRSFPQLALGVTVVAAACGGNVTVDQPAATTKHTTGAGGSTTSNASSGTFASTTTSMVASTSGSGTGGSLDYDASACATTCSYWYMNGGDWLCPDTPATMAKQGLQACGCSGACASPCSEGVCQGTPTPVGSACDQCLQQNCPSQLATCMQN